MESTPDYQHYSQLLKALRLTLMKAEETGQQAEEAVELDQTRVGRLSRMDAMRAQAMSVETGRRRRVQIVKIDNAMARIESGTYGECADCGEYIKPARLEIDPMAVLCIECASLQEGA
jgi:DnaK suppressor protein